ncbi:MAG: 3-phosphoshikimate 1-carboxyvinyltransferase [Anaerolineales bacterium]
MKMKVTPSGPLTGSVALPGDKSISHRAILFSALAEGTSRIKGILVAGVTESMLTALQGLGVEWDLKGRDLAVHGRGLSGLEAPSEPLNCGNSATTMRLLAGACAAAGIPVVLDGSESLRARPMARIVKPLWEMGVPIKALGEGGTAPLQIAMLLRGHSLQGLDYHSPVASAQVKSCLLLAGLAAEGPIRYTEPSPSRDHTERMFSDMGVGIQRKVREDGSVQVAMEPMQKRRIHPLAIAVPGDISSAAFLIVAALITPGSDILLRGVGLNPTRTGMLDALQEMGARIEIRGLRQAHGEPVGDLRVRHSSLQGIQLGDPLVVRMIDELPVFAVAAACAEGETTVKDAGELRLKETDRISALREELRKLGVGIEEREEGFTIQGGAPLMGGRVGAHGDHRMAMALAVAGLNAEKPIEIEGAEMVEESFPGFGRTLKSLGGDVVMEGEP